MPLENANKAILASERTIFDDRGRFTPEVDALRREVRERSSRQGFYTMFGPEEIGGGGLGPVAAVYLNCAALRPIAARAAS